MRVAIFLFLSLLFVLPAAVPSGPGRAAERSLSFESIDLRVNGVVDGVMPGDLDGDGRKDLLVLHSGSELYRSTRFLSVFYQWEGDSFSSAPDQTWAADSLGQAVDVDEAGDGRSASILYLRRDGLWKYTRVGGRFREEGEQVAAHRSFFVSRRNERLLPFEGLVESDRQGRQWITLPGTDGIILFEDSGNGSWVPFDSLAYDLTTSISTGEVHEVPEGMMGLRQEISLPWIARGRLGPGGEGDLFLLYDDRMKAYEFSPEGFDGAGGLLLAYDLAKDLRKEASYFLLRPAVLDLDGDGFSDLVVTRQVGRGIGGYTTTLDLYRGPLEGRSADAPTQRVILEDAMSYFISFDDVDGDGDMELAVPIVKLGLFDIVRILTTKSLKVTVRIFRLDENGLFETAPYWLHEIQADIDFKGGAGEVVGKIMNANGDADKDLAITLEPRKLSVFTGNSRSVPRFFSRKPGIEIDTYADVDLEAIDITGDGLDELIATFGTSMPGAGIVRLYMNRTTPSD
jgi:hypothetical protein